MSTALGFFLTEINKTLWELLLLQMQVHLQTLAELNFSCTIARIYYIYKSGVQWKGKSPLNNEGTLLKMKGLYWNQWFHEEHLKAKFT